MINWNMWVAITSEEFEEITWESDGAYAVTDPDTPHHVTYYAQKEYDKGIKKPVALYIAKTGWNGSNSYYRYKYYEHIHNN